MKRIYIAVAVGMALKEGAAPRLINAGTPAAARLHATKNLYDIRIATTAEVAKLVGKQVAVEEAGEEGQATLAVEPQQQALVSGPVAGRDTRVDTDPIV